MTRPLFGATLLAVALVTARAPAQPPAPPPPERFNAVVRYRIDSPRDQHVALYDLMIAHLKRTGFVFDPPYDTLPETDREDRSKNRITGTVAPVNVLRLFADRHVESVLLAPTGYMQAISAGVEAYSFWPEFVQSDVQLTNCKVVQGPTIADHAFAMLLALTRGLHEYIPGRTKREWGSRDGTPQGMTELPGMTAVIIGAGGIGTQIAQRAHGFGMKVIGVDPRDMPVSNLFPEIVPPDRLDEVLPRADVVFVAAPLTPKSEHMIASKQFDVMKQGAYFIAVSRGRLYDKPALVKALDSKKLAGAGLDVTDPEPLPAGDSLWNFPNVVITPHVASAAEGSNQRRIGVIEDNIRRFSHGVALTHVVDKVKGY